MSADQEVPQPAAAGLATGGAEQPAPGESLPCENTDRHLWPETSDPNAEHESIHVTAQGAIGINVGGYVHVKPLREWHKLAGGKWSVRDEKALTSNGVTPDAWLVEWNGGTHEKVYPDRHEAQRESVILAEDGWEDVEVIPLFRAPAPRFVKMVTDDGEVTVETCPRCAYPGPSVETPAPLTQCPYCERPADSDGGINHVGGCIGLEKVVLNRLQYNSLVGRAFAQKSAGDPHSDLPVEQA